MSKLTNQARQAYARKALESTIEQVAQSAGVQPATVRIWIKKYYPNCVKLEQFSVVQIPDDEHNNDQRRIGADTETLPSNPFVPHIPDRVWADSNHRKLGSILTHNLCRRSVGTLRDISFSIHAYPISKQTPSNHRYRENGTHKGNPILQQNRRILCCYRQN